MNKMVQKNITIISRTFKTLITLVLTIKAIQGQIPSISVNPNPVEIGSEFTAICKVDINNVITFKVNNVVKGTCPFPLGGPQPCTPVDIQQTLATKTTSWTLNATLEYEGIWNCTRLLSESTSLELNMYKCANSVLSESGINSILELNETSAVNISFETACIYPSSNPDVVLQFKSGTEELSSNMNCSASGTACPIGISYECSHQISFKMPLTNDKVFSMQKSYTLHFKASPSIGDCDSVAIFDQFSLRFISTGPKTTTEEPITSEQATISSSIISTDISHSTTIGSGSDSTDTVSIINVSTDQVTSMNAVTNTEPKSVFAPLVISVSVVITCLVVTSVVIVCVMYHKRNTKDQNRSDTSLNPSSKNDYMHHRNLTNDKKANFKESESRFISRKEYSPEIYPNTYSHSGGNMPEQRSRYVNNLNSVNNRMEYNEQTFEMSNQPHAHSSRQTRQMHFV